MDDSDTSPGVTPAERDELASERDAQARSRDAVASVRDTFAVQRDVLAQTRDDSLGATDPDAKADRIAAQNDRLSAAVDREHAHADREESWFDRLVASDDRAGTLLDDLTGVYRRGAGFLELEREIVKAERTEHAFVLAFIDVDGLKVINDTRGHDAGDALLREVVDCMRSVFREYDVFVRFGGDEFLCGVADLSADEVDVRFERARVELGRRNRGSFTVGLAEHQRDEGLQSLIERADAAMYVNRRRRAAEDDADRAHRSTPATFRLRVHGDLERA